MWRVASLRSSSTRTSSVTWSARFARYDNVMIVGGDFLALPLPADRFRLFGNIPFGTTTSLLRHLLEPTRAMYQADLIVERGAAMKRAASRPGNVLNLAWGPWWRFTMGRRIPADRFSPPPSVDAAMLTVRRREVALLAEQARRGYAIFIRACFASSDLSGALRGQLGQRRWAAMTSTVRTRPDDCRA